MNTRQIVTSGFKQTFDFRGVSSRRETVIWLLFQVIAQFVIWSLSLFVQGPASTEPDGQLGLGLLVTIVQLAVLSPTLAMLVRRFRDAGKSPAVLLVLLVFPGLEYWRVSNGLPDYALEYVFWAFILWFISFVTLMTWVLSPSVQKNPSAENPSSAG